MKLKFDTKLFIVLSTVVSAWGNPIETKYINQCIVKLESLVFDTTLDHYICNVQCYMMDGFFASIACTT